MVFRQGLVFRLLVSFAFALVYGLFLGLAAGFFFELRTAANLLGCMFVIAIATFGAVFVFHRQITLTVSPREITFNSGMWIIRSEWHNIDRVGIVKSWSPYREGIILKESRLSYSWIWSAHITFMRITAPDFGFSIPLGPFVWGNWRQTPLGAEILKYAPQLESKP